MLFSTASAQLTGGEISLASNNLLTYAKTCVNYCMSSWVDCYPTVYNHTSPTGGTGQYKYSWEQKDRWGAWTAMADTTNTINIPPPAQLEDKYYYRRKVKDAGNMMDSAYSNEVQVGTFFYAHGSLTFGSSSGDNVVWVPVGTSPPEIWSSAFTDAPGGYIAWEEKVGNGYWQFTVSSPSDMTIYQPPTRNTDTVVYYRDYVAGYCGDYDTTYSNIATIYFYVPLVFDAGTISANVDSACSGRIINLTGTTTTAPQPYHYFWEYSADNVYWSYLNGSVQDYSDSTYTSTRYYRRGVSAGFGGSTTKYSNVVKVSRKSNGCPVMTAGVISAGTPSCNSLTLTGTAATSNLPFTYLWQYSDYGYVWYDCDTTADYTDTTYTQGRYYRRLLLSDSILKLSNSLKVTTYPAGLGKPDSVVRNKWYVACYNPPKIPFGNDVYRGYYINDSLDINTTTEWPATKSPSFINGYSGCNVDTNRFRITERRKGFPSGKYQARVLSNPGGIQIYKNGSYLTGSYLRDTMMKDLGSLDTNSTLEIRCTTDTLNIPIYVDMVKVGARPAAYVDSACNTFSLTNTAVNPNGNSLADVSVNMKHSPPGPANIPTDINGIKYLPRYFNFKSSSYNGVAFSYPVRVRLYFLNSEFDDYKTAVNQPTLTINQLRITHYDGVNEDCDMNNNTAMGTVRTPVSTGVFGTDGFYLDLDVNSFSEFGVIQEGSIVPLKWLYATAAKVNSDVAVQWKVADELNNSGFEVQRSSDGFSFETIATVKSRGSVLSSEYAYTDKTAPAIANLYYRIKQVDKDGKWSLSNVMKVRFGKEKSITIYPNPVTDKAIITSADIIRQVVVADASGKVVQRVDCFTSAITVNTGQLSKGIYMVRAILATGEEKTMKMVKD